MSIDPQASNPYAPTTEVAAQPVPTDDVEAYRNFYLKHEASVKSIGTLYLLGALILIPMGFIAFFIGVSGNAGQESMVVAGVGVFYLALGTLQGFTAVGLRRLRPWARIVTIVFAVIGLIGIPIGTLISILILYLLLSEKGKVVFSDHYQEVIVQTPHIKYKTSMVVKVLLGILLAIIGLGIAAALLAGG